MTEPVGRADGWTWVRRGALLAYLGVVIAITVTSGIPTGRQAIAVLIIVGLGITRIGYGWRALVQVVIDWLPFTLVLIAYDRTRGVADAVGLPLHESDIVAAEKWCFGGHIPTVWLQQRMYDAMHVHWYDALITLIYTSHFLATPVLAAVLWLRDRAQWLRYISRVVVLSVAGLITFVLFPEAPPWLAAQDGVIAQPVARLSARGYEWLHVGDVQAALSHAQEAGANPVAAMPSLHIAFAVLFAIFIASRLRTRWRYALALYPLAMGFTLVYTGEHYVLDLVADAGYALVVHALISLWERRRAERQRPAAAATAGSDPLAAR